jgi:hypothetical protein
MIEESEKVLPVIPISIKVFIVKTPIKALLFVQGILLCHHISRHENLPVLVLQD